MSSRLLTLLLPRQTSTTFESTSCTLRLLASLVSPALPTSSSSSSSPLSSVIVHEPPLALNLSPQPTIRAFASDIALFISIPYPSIANFTSFFPCLYLPLPLSFTFVPLDCIIIFLINLWFFDPSSNPFNPFIS